MSRSYKTYYTDDSDSSSDDDDNTALGLFCVAGIIFFIFLGLAGIGVYVLLGETEDELSPLVNAVDTNKPSASHAATMKELAKKIAEAEKLASKSGVSPKELKEIAKEAKVDGAEESAVEDPEAKSEEDKTGEGGEENKEGGDTDQEKEGEGKKSEEEEEDNGKKETTFVKILSGLSFIGGNIMIALGVISNPYYMWELNPEVSKIDVERSVFLLKDGVELSDDVGCIKEIQTLDAPHDVVTKWKSEPNGFEDSTFTFKVDSEDEGTKYTIETTETFEDPRIIKLDPIAVVLRQEEYTMPAIDNADKVWRLKDSKFEGTTVNVNPMSDGAFERIKKSETHKDMTKEEFDKIVELIKDAQDTEDPLSEDQLATLNEKLELEKIEHYMYCFNKTPASIAVLALGIMAVLFAFYMWCMFFRKKRAFGNSKWCYGEPEDSPCW